MRSKDLYTHIHTHTHTHTHTQTHTYIFIHTDVHTHVKTSCIILKPRRGANFITNRKFQNIHFRLSITTKKYIWVDFHSKTEAKFHYFHHRKFENLHLQPLRPNNPNLFPVSYLRFLDEEGFYEKMLTRQLCKKSLCCLPPNLNKF